MWSRVKSLRQKQAKISARELLWRGIRLGVYSVAVTTGLVSVGYFAHDALVQPGRLPIRSVQVTGELNHVTQQQVVQQLSQFAGQNFFTADLEAARKQVLQLPWVKTASVRRVWPDAIAVVAVEYQAFARWADGGLLTRDGILFKPDTSSYPNGLPQLRGPAGSEMLVTLEYQKFAKVFTDGELQVTEVDLNDRHSWRLKFANGLELVVGRNIDEYRLKRFSSLYANYSAEFRDQVERIDLRYANGFAVRRRGDSAAG